jgi:hypothetical protein
VKHFLPFLVGIIFALPAAAAQGITLEAGMSYFMLRHEQLEFSPAPLTVDQPDRLAPFVGLRTALTDRFGLRASYQFVNNVRATAQFGYPPGNPSSPLPIIVWGHYDDDLHIFSLAPEITWLVAPRLNVALSPQLNWVKSRGLVRYSTDNALILLQAPRERSDDGFTWGGAARFDWAFSAKSGLFATYQLIDLEPSFERQAHVISAGMSWKF